MPAKTGEPQRKEVGKIFSITQTTFCRQQPAEALGAEAFPFSPQKRKAGPSTSHGCHRRTTPGRGTPPRCGGSTRSTAARRQHRPGRGGARASGRGCGRCHLTGAARRHPQGYDLPPPYPRSVSSPLRLEVQFKQPN